MHRLLIFLLLIAQLCFAQNRMAKDTLVTPIYKPAIAVGSLIHDFSIPVAVLDSTDLRNSSYNTPADAMANQPGVFLVRDGIWGTSVNIHGVSEQRLLMLVDGDRIQTSSDIAGALSTVDMGALQRIEIVKGAGSVLYGSGAMGGIVNFVTDKSFYSVRPRAYGKVGTSINSVNGLWANYANVNYTSGNYFLSANGSFRTAGNTQSPNGVIASSQFHDASWSLRSGVKYAANEEVVVNYQHFKGWDIGIPGVSEFNSTASVRYLGVKRDQLNGEYIVTNVNDYLTKLSVKAYTQSVSQEVEVFPLGIQSSYPKTKLFPNSTNTTYGAKLLTDWELEEDQNAVLGAEVWQKKLETLRVRQVFSSDSLLTVTHEQPTANSKQLDVGVFAYYSWDILPKILKLNIGLRGDYFKTDNDSAFNPVYKYTITGGAVDVVNKITKTTLFVADSKNEYGYAAHADLLWHLTSYQSLALSVSNSYRSPSLDERFKYNDLGSIIHVGNPDLKPEWGTFANLNYSISTGAIRMKTDCYINYLFNLITEKQGTFLGKTAYVNANVGKALYTGADIEATWRLADHFQMDANMSYVYTRDLKNHQPLPQIPPMNGSLGLAYKSGGFLDAEFNAKWAADQNDVASTEKTTPGYVVYNINMQTRTFLVGYTLWRFCSGVDNLLNTAYYNHLNSVRSGGARYYEPGLNLWIRAIMNF